MRKESQEVKGLLDQLCEQTIHSFPKHRQSLDAPLKQGVYIIRKKNIVLHVGRTQRGKYGLNQRLNNHLHNESSFTNEFLKGKGEKLRKNRHTYQYLIVKNPRKRALLEALATGTLCPKHIGLGE